MYEADVLEKPVTTDNGENIFSHIAEASKITEAYVTGNPVVALCGKVFVPTRDPKNLEVCPECKEIANSLFINYSL